MSNYPNMSYCMYENIVHAMNQICNDLSDSIDNYVSLNEYANSPEARLQYA